jgi:hypothetical protein
MKRLEGVIDISSDDIEILKQHSLFFDGLHVTRLLNVKPAYEVLSEPDLDYLCEKGFVRIVDRNYVNSIFSRQEMYENKELQAAAMQSLLKTDPESQFVANSDEDSDFTVRSLSWALGSDYPDAETVPICRKSLPDGLKEEERRVVLEVAMEQFPMPGPMSAWEDILNFKEDAMEKQWGLRRFLSELSTKKHSEAEIRDHISWTLNEYRNAMKLHHMKVGNGFIEVYVIPVVEVMEDLVTFHWSKVAKGIFGVRKRKIELMEAEMKAPGRECAYVFEAQKRFGRPA